MKSGILFLLASLFLAAPGNALPATMEERVKVFAQCTGRFSALMEHQWMFDGDASEETALRRADFNAMLDAVLPLALERGLTGTTALHWQLEAKMAQAVLLQQAVFGQNPARAQAAARSAANHLELCNHLLLGA